MNEIYKYMINNKRFGNRSMAVFLACILFLINPLVASAQQPLDVSLGAALACGTDTDFESTIFRQDHLLIAMSATDVDCQIPFVTGKRLVRVWVRMTNINGFSAETVCRVESNHPITNQLNQGDAIAAPTGEERTNLRLPVPRPISRSGYWTINCKLQDGSVLRGFRYVYR